LKKSKPDKEKQMQKPTRSCDGISRRDLLQAGFGGACAATGLLGLSPYSGTQLLAANAIKKDISLIILFTRGGLSTIDTLDMKPEAPAEFRGEFKPIDTKVPGIQVCEHLPGFVKVANKFSLIRSMTHTNSNHGQADHYMLTGYHPSPSFKGNLKPNNERPCHGSIISKMLGPKGSVPPYVALPMMHPSGGSAYLGPSSAPFIVNADPNAPDFSVPDLVPPLSIDASRLNRRQELLKQMDRFIKSNEIAANRKAKSMNTFQSKAFDLITSKETRKAFDLFQEPDKLRDEYGRHSLGQMCLMGRRLVEAGVRCVTLMHNDWDTHFNNFHVLKNDLLPHLNTGLPALLRDLDDRGLLKTTMVISMGEFGRTPRINKMAGRDHWGSTNTILIAGGGIKGGQIVGKTDSKGERPEGESHGPEDLAATIYHCLGINPNHNFLTPEGRPIPIVNDGRLISELI
jgi:Protein of unknown function (DUF1501)